jgi:hypothetical protein
MAPSVVEVSTLPDALLSVHASERQAALAARVPMTSTDARHGERPVTRGPATGCVVDHRAEPNGPAPRYVIDPSSDAAVDVTATASGGSGLDPDPPGPTGSTHRLTRASVLPVWWSPPVTRNGHIVDLDGVLTERRTGRHRAFGVSRSRLVAGVGRRWTPTNEGR